MFRRVSRWHSAIVVAGGVSLATVAVASSLERIAISLNSRHIQGALFDLRDLRLDWRGGQGSITVGVLEALGQRWRDVRIACRKLSLETGAFRCENGQIALPRLPPVALTLTQQGETWRLLLQPSAGERWEASYHATGSARLDIRNGKPELLFALLPRLVELKNALNPVGRLNGRLEYQPRRFDGTLNLARGGYASVDGENAAENLDATLTLSGHAQKGQWQVKGSVAWDQGAIYSKPVFLKSDQQHLSFSGALDGKGWSLETATLQWPGVGAISARGKGDWSRITEGRLVARSLELAPLGNTLLQPFLESRALPRVDLSGQVGLDLSLKDNALVQADIVPRDSGFVLENGRLKLEGLAGRVLWRGDAPGEGALRVGRMALGRLESGAFDLPLAIWPQSFALAGGVTMPLLDGALVVNHLAAGYARGEWQGALGLSIEPVSLELLTPALDLPIMSGKLSANLPIIRYENREAALDGALVVQVFGGYLNCRDLRFLDPFGVRPRILADVDARHLDLAQLTQTFSFGRITGFVDARLAGLELAAWRPLAFDARIESSPGSYPRRISQRAVDNIASLGGGGALASIQASVLRFFKDFGYRRIGLSCRLENGVCHMAGIAGLDRSERYAIVEGGGIPALTVMGYNRGIDWEELIARVKAAINAPDPVIE